MIENDDVFDALAVVRRRKLLVGLLEHEPRHVTRLSETARELSQANEAYLREFLDGPMEIEGVEKTAVRLHLVDLPKLAEQGFVEWSPGAHRVTRGPRFGELRPVLELLDEFEVGGEAAPEFVTTPR